MRWQTETENENIIGYFLLCKVNKRIVEKNTNKKSAIFLCFN